MGSSFRHAVTVTRGAAGSYSHGIYSAGTTSTLTIQASVQPTKPNDTLLLPELRRNDKAFVLFSDTVLNLVNGSTPPDRVSLFGETFEILAQDPWQNNVINHYKYVAAKVQP